MIKHTWMQMCVCVCVYVCVCMCVRVCVCESCSLRPNMADGEVIPQAELELFLILLDLASSF